MNGVHRCLEPMQPIPSLCSSSASLSKNTSQLCFFSNLIPFSPFFLVPFSFSLKTIPSEMGRQRAASAVCWYLSSARCSFTCAEIRLTGKERKETFTLYLMWMSPALCSLRCSQGLSPTQMIKWYNDNALALIVDGNLSSYRQIVSIKGTLENWRYIQLKFKWASFSIINEQCFQCNGYF